MAQRRAGQPGSTRTMPRNSTALPARDRADRPARDAARRPTDSTGQPKALAMGVQDRPAPEPSADASAGACREFGRAGVYGGTCGLHHDHRQPALRPRRSGQTRRTKCRAASPTLLSADAEPADRSRARPADAANSPTGSPRPAIRSPRASWRTARGTGSSGAASSRAWTTSAPPASSRATPRCSITSPRAFMENGWSVKKLVREIVLSRSYQLSSAFDDKNFAADPENTLVWRAANAGSTPSASATPCSPSAATCASTPPVGFGGRRGGDGPIGAPRVRGRERRRRSMPKR